MTPSRLRCVHLTLSAVSNLPYMWARMLDQFGNSENLHIYGGSDLWNGWTTDIKILDGPESRDRAIAAIEAADVVLCYAHTNPLRALGRQNIWPAVQGKPVIFVLAVEPFVIWTQRFELSLWVPGARTGRPILVTGDMVDAFPTGDLVPIAVPAHEAEYAFSPAPEVIDGRFRIVLASTNDEVKGVRLMRAAAQRLGQLSSRTIELDYISEISHRQLMRRKRDAHLVFDLLTPGGWGLNGLEAGSLGRVTLARFSPEVAAIYDEHLGCGPTPTINVLDDDVETLARTLLPYVEDDAMRQEKGRETREWVERHWSTRARAPRLEAVIASHLEAA